MEYLRTYAKIIHVPTRNVRMNVEIPCSNIPSWDYLRRTQIFLLIHNYRVVIRKTSLAGLFAPSAKSPNLDQYITFCVRKLHVLYLDPADPRYLDEKEELWET